MKKLFKIALLIALVFVSCEDDVPNYVAPNYLAGNWKIVEVGTPNSSNIINYVTNSNGDCQDDTIIFNINNTFQLNDVTNTSGSCETQTIDGTYDLVNRTATLTYSTLVNNVLTEVNIAYTLVYLYQNEALLAYKDNFGINRFWKVERIIEE